MSIQLCRLDSKKYSSRQYCFLHSCCTDNVFITIYDRQALKVFTPYKLDYYEKKKIEIVDFRFLPIHVVRLDSLFRLFITLAKV